MTTVDYACVQRQFMGVASPRLLPFAIRVDERDERSG
jgi:hypothetical protein